jgi:hypothetical protein
VGVPWGRRAVNIIVARFRREDGGRISRDGHKRRRVSVPGAAGIGLPARELSALSRLMDVDYSRSILSRVGSARGAVLSSRQRAIARGCASDRGNALCVC